jgi:hypothetical protein
MNECWRDQVPAAAARLPGSLIIGDHFGGGEKTTASQHLDRRRTVVVPDCSITWMTDDSSSFVF